VQAFTHIVPSRYFVEALTAVVLKGTSVDVVWPDVGDACYVQRDSLCEKAPRPLGEAQDGSRGHKVIQPQFWGEKEPKWKCRRLELGLDSLSRAQKLGSCLATVLVGLAEEFLAVNGVETTPPEAVEP
jgi:hypothetical protein